MPRRTRTPTAPEGCPHGPRPDPRPPRQGAAELAAPWQQLREQYLTAELCAGFVKCHLVPALRGDGGRFQRVIVATQANQLGFLDAEQFGREVAALRSIRFDHGELLVHSDTRFLPARRQDWTALNYLMDRSLERAMFTVWVNAVEPTLRDAPPVFQTWNPLFEPDPATVIARLPLARAVVDVFALLLAVAGPGWWLLRRANRAV